MKDPLRKAGIQERPHLTDLLPSPPPYSAEPGSSNRKSLRYYQPTQHTIWYAPSPYDTPLPGTAKPRGWVKKLAPGKSPAKLLDPTPASFLRPPPLRLQPDLTFPPMELLGKGPMLDGGFPYVAPHCPMLPHPFVTHDVNEHDWRQFLHDVRVAGSLSPTDRIVSGLLPMLLGFGILLGVFTTLGLEGCVRRRKRGPVSQLIEHWNVLFFHPRSIHIALSKGPLGGTPDRDRSPAGSPSQPTDKNWRLIVSYQPYNIC
ncbi:hypothetical protein BD413DRAFT_609706 [Trametes elegans]|nr:hypothetical protein BD413DRAFT_609706 [Trametes elegans]